MISCEMTRRHEFFMADINQFELKIKNKFVPWQLTHEQTQDSLSVSSNLLQHAETVKKDLKIM